MILTSLFSYHSVILVHENDHVIYPYSATILDDNSKVAYMISHNNSSYLVIKDLNKQNSSIYSLCQSICLPINNDHNYNLKFFNNELIFIYDYDTSNLDNPHSFLYSYNLINKQLIRVDDGCSGISADLMIINTSLFCIKPYYTNNGSISLRNENTQQTFYINLEQDFNKTLYKITLSPNFTKLAALVFSKESGYEIRYYDINNLKVTYINRTFLQLPGKEIFDFLDSSTFHFLSWSNLTSLYYQYDKSSKTELFMFNYSNNELKSVVLLAGNQYISTINPNNSLFTTRSEIYSYKDSNPKLTKKTNYSFLYVDNSINYIISRDQTGGKLILLTYRSSSNTIKERILDVNLLPSDDIILNYMGYITIIISVILLIYLFSLLIEDNFPVKKE